MLLEPLPPFTPCKRGDKGPDVRRVQEWLTLHGIGCEIDGDFGPATAAAFARWGRALHTHGDVRQLAALAYLADPSTVTDPLMAELEAPLYNACEDVTDARDGDFLPAVVRYAEQHLDHHPREVGGQNMGPWVRLYMRGREGRQWAWCAGFVRYVCEQAARQCGVDLPFAISYSCTTLAERAKTVGRFHPRVPLHADHVEVAHAIKPGYIFLVRRDDYSWSHTGIVTGVHEDHVEVIHGNSNDEGSREGYEVCRGIMSYARLDFVCPA